MFREKQDIKIEMENRKWLHFLQIENYNVPIYKINYTYI